MGKTNWIVTTDEHGVKFAVSASHVVMIRGLPNGNGALIRLITGDAVQTTSSVDQVIEQMPDFFRSQP